MITGGGMVTVAGGTGTRAGGGNDVGGFMPPGDGKSGGGLKRWYEAEVYGATGARDGVLSEGGRPRCDTGAPEAPVEY